MPCLLHPNARIEARDSMCSLVRMLCPGLLLAVACLIEAGALAQVAPSAKPLDPGLGRPLAFLFCFWCGFGGQRSREPFGHAAADVAGIAAGPFRELAEVGADVEMAAAAALYKIADVTVALPGAVTLGGILKLIDEIREQAGILGLPEKDAIGGQPVPSCAAGLLINLLQRLRERKVDHRSHGRLVDAESECNGANQHMDFV